MKKYIITATSTCVEEYIVEADSKDEARESFFEGNYISCEEVDNTNQEIQYIEDLEK